MRTLRAVVVAVVVLVAFAFGLARITDNDGEQVATPRLEQSLAGLSIATSTKIRLSPDGTRLSVVEGGQVVIVGLNDAKVVSRAGRSVADAAWMPDASRVLVVEGPIPTGQVTTLKIDGSTDGVQQLKPSVGFGGGHGVAVDERGTRAAVIVENRDPIGGRVRTDLAVVELQTGAVRVYPTPERDEARPLFVDDDLIALATTGESGPARLDLVDRVSGAVTTGRPITAGPFARTSGEEVVVARGASQGATRLVAVDVASGEEREVHVTKPHRRVVAVDAGGGRCVVRVPDGNGEAHLEIESFA